MNFKQMANVTADMIGENMFDRRNGVFVVSTTRCYLFNNNPMKGDPDDSLRDKQFEAMRNWGEETGTFKALAEGGTEYDTLGGRDQPGKSYTRVMLIEGADIDESVLEQKWSDLWVESMKKCIAG